MAPRCHVTGAPARRPGATDSVGVRRLRIRGPRKEIAGSAARIGFAAPPGQRYTARRLKLFALAVALVALALLSGCTTGRYLAQAGCGQIDLLLRARDIGAVARDPNVDPRIR